MVSSRMHSNGFDSILDLNILSGSFFVPGPHIKIALYAVMREQGHTGHFGIYGVMCA